MSIKIAYEKVVVRGVKKIRVLSVEALRDRELPESYLEVDGSTFDRKANGDFVYLDPDCGRHLCIVAAGESPSSAHALYENSIYDPKKFFEAVEIARRAGERLREINQKIAKLKESWHGETELSI
jgi:hypothetical protein